MIRETTHTPQGDGNSQSPPSGASACRNNPHPARGRKRRRSRSVLLPTGNNPHPARGRKLLKNPLLLCKISGNNPHPARGRKQPGRHDFGNKRETTHTPQGDGNSSTMTLYWVGAETTHTPQGDGNLFDVHAFLRTRKQPTPRKGTETDRPRDRCCRVPETTHTPQGDGNSLLFQNVWIVTETTPTPQGDGNRPYPLPRCTHRGNNPHPARGRKTICVHIAEIVGETIHIPDRGQLTKKERETP